MPMPLSRLLPARAAFQYISANGKQYRCLNDCTPVVTVTGFKDVSSGDELALMDAVAQQPVSVGIDASEYPFMLYKARAHLAPARALRAQALDRASASEGGVSSARRSFLSFPA